jgi:hypothetical protein
MKLDRLFFGRDAMKRILLVALILSGCAVAPTPEPYSDEKMTIAASALTKVAAAAEGMARYGQVPNGTSDEAFLILATEHDPALLQPFANYRVRARRQDRHAAVLLCTADGSEALIEDLGCTAASDVHHWRSLPRHGCEFSLDLAEVCKQK